LFAVPARTIQNSAAGYHQRADSMQFWLYQVPNLILAALMYTLLGRFLLSLVFAPASEKVIWRVFTQITDPALKAVRFITPQIVPLHLLVLFAALWTLLARIGLFMGFAAAGFRPLGA
jgi:uncharacterized protein YggT (Ycf19 family)